MPLVDLTNPDVIKFFIENYDKTTRLRMKWNRLHSDKLQQAATLQRPEKGYYEKDVLKETMIAGMSTITRDHKVARFNRRRLQIRDSVHIPGIADMKKGNSITDVGLGSSDDDPRLGRPDTDLSVDPVMRPVNPNEKRIIYGDIPFKGRVVYLNSRKRTLPEKRYYFRECSAWEYGWRLNDSYFKRNAPTHGRVWRLTRDVNCRTGPHPDPKHYKDSDLPTSTKCII